MSNSTSQGSTSQAQVFISQTRRGMWVWNRRTRPGIIYTSREMFVSELAALQAAADIATGGGDKLRVNAYQQARIILYWLDRGREAFRAGAHIGLLRNPHMRRGWMMAAEDEAAREEAARKSGLDAPAQLSLTLEEALDIQIRSNRETIDRVNALLREMEAR